jgi:hypothetical protein
MTDRWMLVLIALPLFAYLVYAIGETITRPSLTPGRRAAWCLFLLAVPVASLVVYVVVRPVRSTRRIRRGPPATGRADSIVELVERRQRGESSDDHYRSEMQALKVNRP